MAQLSNSKDYNEQIRGLEDIKQDMAIIREKSLLNTEAQLIEENSTKLLQQGMDSLVKETEARNKMDFERKVDYFTKESEKEKLDKDIIEIVKMETLDSKKDLEKTIMNSVIQDSLKQIPKVINDLGI